MYRLSNLMNTDPYEIENMLTSQSQFFNRPKKLSIVQGVSMQQSISNFFGSLIVRLITVTKIENESFVTIDLTSLFVVVLVVFLSIAAVTKFLSKFF